MEKYTITVDWLQTFGHCQPLAAGIYNSGNYKFLIKDTGHETAIYKKMYSVHSNGIKVATIYQEPRNSVMNKAATGIKLENRILYHQRYVELLYALQKAIKFQYKGITRLDIAYDCNFLHGGRKVDKFIKQFIQAEPLTKGHIIRNGSSRFAVHGTKNSTSIATYNSIRFGSPQSRIGAYCYNKTLELLEVKDKPYIREFWEQNGLISKVDKETLDNMDKKKRVKETDQNTLANFVNVPVWRFEISIKCQGMDILNMRTGELFRLSPRYLESQERIEQIFYIYAGKVFDFRINTGQSRTRNYPKLQIFENSPKLTAKPYAINKYADTGRMERICYNKLEQLSEEYADIAEGKRKALITAMEFLTELAGVKQNIIKERKHLQYLNSLLGNKRITEHTHMYFGLLEQANEAHRELDAEYLYDLSLGLHEENSQIYWQDPYEDSFLG